MSKHETERWTCRGSVRGECGVVHRSEEAAERHCARDQRACQSLSPSGSLTQTYSDRYPVRVRDR